MDINIDLIVDSLPLLFMGAGVTIKITALSMAVGVVIGLFVVTRRGQLIIARTYSSLEIWLCVAVFYLILTLSVSRPVAYLEKWYGIDGGN